MDHSVPQPHSLASLCQAYDLSAIRPVPYLIPFCGVLAGEWIGAEGYPMYVC